MSDDTTDAVLTGDLTEHLEPDQLVAIEDAVEHAGFTIEVNFADSSFTITPEQTDSNGTDTDSADESASDPDPEPVADQEPADDDDGTGTDQNDTTDDSEETTDDQSVIADATDPSSSDQDSDQESADIEDPRFEGDDTFTLDSFRDLSTDERAQHIKAIIREHQPISAPDITEQLFGPGVSTEDTEYKEVHNRLYNNLNDVVDKETNEDGATVYVFPDDDDAKDQEGGSGKNRQGTRPKTVTTA